MTRTMLAAVYHGQHDIRFEQRPVPEPDPGELLIEVGTVGVCGTDAHEWAHGPHLHPVAVRHPATGWLGPITPGHEFSGVVTAVGDGVDASWIGRSVASCGSVACMRCDACRRGESNQCRHYNGVGLHRPGALAEFVTTPVENCLAVDHLGISLDEAALCQPMSIAVHNVARAKAVAGQPALVLGIGGIGAFLVAALADEGVEVIAADLDEERLRVAADMGADITVLAGRADSDEQIADALAGRDLRVAFEVSGSPAGIRTALQVTSPGARIVVVGLPKAPVDIDLARLSLQEKTLVGSNALVREVDFPRAVELIAKRRGRWNRIAPIVIPMVGGLVGDALEPMAAGRPRVIKTLVDPRGTQERQVRTGTR